MIIYNTTYHIEDSTQSDWIKWMKQTYIPLIFETGLFTRHYFCRIMADEQMGGKTYSLQLFVKEKELLERYQKEFAPKLQSLLNTRFANQVLTFSTQMEEV